MARRGSRSLSVDATDLMASITRLGPRVEAAAYAVLERQGDLAVAHMKTDAPWTDRTGVARSTLDSTVFKRGSRLYLNLFGRAPYQIYLETKNGGKFAIIGPTIVTWGPRIMRSFAGLIDRLR